jgi:hypothetical protein
MSNKTPTIPTFYDAMQNWRRSLFYNLYCHLPGEVVTYDRATGTATVQPGFKRVVPNYTVPAGQTIRPYAPIKRVPVFTAQGGRVSLGADPAPGDPCLLLVLDRNAEAWVQNGGQQAPLSDRAHDLSDCFALVGFNPLSAPLASARLAGEAGIAEPLAGTGAKVVVKSGKISIANNAENLSVTLGNLVTELLTMNTTLAAMTTASIAAGTTQTALAAQTASIAALLADLAALLY